MLAHSIGPSRHWSTGNSSSWHVRQQKMSNWSLDQITSMSWSHGAKFSNMHMQSYLRLKPMRYNPINSIRISGYVRV